MLNIPEKYRAFPCPCGHPSCKAWMVDPVAAVQCVRFTEPQARATAHLLNTLDFCAGLPSVQQKFLQLLHEEGAQRVNPENDVVMLAARNLHRYGLVTDAHPVGVGKARRLRVDITDLGHYAVTAALTP